MKIKELFEATDFTPVLQTVFASKEYKDFSKRFDSISTARQHKNGTLYFTTKPEILAQPREFTVNSSGMIKVKNAHASIWATASSIFMHSKPMETEYIEALHAIDELFNDWVNKRAKSQTDVSNSGLSSLTERNFTRKVTKFDFSHNKLKDLVGIPEFDDKEAERSLFANSNELTSLKGIPDIKFRYLHFDKNKLTSFEGFPKQSLYIVISGNPFTSFSDVHKHIENCQQFTLPVVKTGLLSFFKIKDCISITFYSFGAKEPELAKECEAAAKIVTKHLQSGYNLFACQTELMEAGLKDYAKL
jgi:hypothetical protein